MDKLITNISKELDIFWIIMNLLYLFCFFLFSTSRPVCYSSTDGNSYNDLDNFNRWRLKYNKTYDNEFNLSTYFTDWKNNRNYINQHNSKNNDFELELNAFADIHWSKWLGRKGYNFVMATDSLRTEVFENNDKNMNLEMNLEMNLDMNLPSSIDWRKRDVVTSVKNQQQCGSCWAFSAVASMEGQHALQTGKLVNLSESQIVDCDINGSDSGCDGGWMDGAFKYVIAQGGVDTDESYPYDPQDDPCQFNKSNVGAKFSNYKNVKGGEAGLKKVVATIGPISVAIDASNPEFQFYKKGVYYDKTCSSTMLDHGVLVVGYGTTKNGTDYWIVKNSWGADWGDKGYIWMSRNRDNNCGIASKPSYPIV